MTFRQQHQEGRGTKQKRYISLICMCDGGGRQRDGTKSPQREGLSRSIGGGRCRLSAFVAVREAELGLIVPIQPDLELV